MLLSKVLIFLSSCFHWDKWCCERGLNSRPLHYQWSALPLSYRSMARPARARGRRRACAIGSGVWQAVMGRKGGLAVHGAGSMARLGLSGLTSRAVAPMENPFQPRRSPLSRSPEPSGPAGDPMNDNSPNANSPHADASPVENASPTSPAAPAPAGARKADPRAAERLAAALRENLRRRKQQAKARRSEAAIPEGQGQD